MKTEELIKECENVIEWHLNNSKPDEDYKHSDFFNMSANCLEQIKLWFENNKILNPCEGDVKNNL